MHPDHYMLVKIPPQALQYGHYYAGRCRNATIARWDAQRQLFIHWRFKFGGYHLDDIGYWDPNGIYDGFIPVFDLGQEIPQEIPLD